MKRLFTALAAIMLVALLHAQSLRLPQFFADGMVLQRNTLVPVWGWAQAGTSVMVDINGNKVKTTAATKGEWTVKLPKMTVSGPQPIRLIPEITTYLRQNQSLITAEFFS